MRTFNDYLLEQRLAEKTIRNYTSHLNKYLSWLKETGQEVNEIKYAELLNYIKCQEKRATTKNQINSYLIAVRHYYNYLKQLKRIEVNPATGLYIKGETRRLPHGLLNEEQLQSLYENYTTNDLISQRNKVIVGLLVYQGLTANELSKLEPEHLNLRQGIIEVPGTTKTNRRILKLESNQLLDLQEYQLITRKELLTESQKTTPYLLTSSGSSTALRGTLEKLSKTLKRQSDYFTHFGQLRQSRITIWVKQYGIREVQQMAGHKYVSSTERYQKVSQEALLNELVKYHPLQ